jgi:hypothetical protein
MGEHNSDKPQACIRDAGTKGGGRSAMSHFCRTSAGDHGKETSRHGDGEDRSRGITLPEQGLGRLERPSNALLELLLQERLGRIRLTG